MGASVSMARLGADCILITDDHLPHRGGSRIYVHKIASILADSITLVTRYRPGAQQFDRALPYVVERMRLRGGLLGGPAVLGEGLDAISLAAGALRLPTPRCYLAGEVMPTAFVAAAVAKARGLAYGVILHDEPMLGAGRVEAAARRRVLGGASAIIAASSFPARRAKELVRDRVPVFVAPPGVDLDTFKPGKPREKTLGMFDVERGRYLLSVGRLVDYKNIEAIIASAARVRDARFKVVVVGRGPHRPALEALTRRLSMQGRVVFTERIDTPTLVDLYRGAFAYIFASRRVGGRQHEGIGMAALEAGACGCTVIASTETCACDFIEEGKTGLLFDPARDGALDGCLKRLVEIPEKQTTMARNCSRRVRSTYTWAAAAATVTAALEELCRPPGVLDAKSLQS